MMAINLFSSATVWNNSSVVTVYFEHYNNTAKLYVHIDFLLAEPYIHFKLRELDVEKCKYF